MTEFEKGDCNITALVSPNGESCVAYKDKIIVGVKKENHDDLWHAYYREFGGSYPWGQLTYIRVTESVAKELFVALL